MTFTTDPAELRRILFDPASVALVGASDDPKKTPARPLRYLRDKGWKGRLYPINPRRSTVLGERAWPSLADLPEVPEHALILTTADLAVDAAQHCADLGVRVATIVADGFAEAGPEGVRRAERLRAIVEGSSLRLVGPASIGLADLRHSLLLTANAAFAEPELPSGDIFVASHSGSLIGSLVSRAKVLGQGFAGMVATGGEVDLGVGEVCSATLDDPGIKGYVLFLESLRGAGRLRAFAEQAAARGKPVVAYKLGRSEAGAALSVSHTGALAGDDAVASALLADSGIARVHVLDALLEAIPLNARVPLADAVPATPRVGVITTTGGGGAMVVDQLGVRGISVQQPTPETLRRLAAAGVNAAPGHMIDLTLAGARYEIMKGALDVMLTAPEFDMVVAVPGSSARFQPELAVAPIADSQGTGAPLAAFVVPEAPDALRLLREAGVAAFRTPESCADAVAAVFSRRAPRARTVTEVPAGRGRVLDERESYAFLAGLGVPHAAFHVLEQDEEPDELPLPEPVVAKALAADIPHKSDVGGVVTGITDAAGLRAAIGRIQEGVRAARGRGPDAILVQEQVAGVAEVLLGYRHDPEAGPVVVLAAGGVTAELYRDRAVRLAPVDLDTAYAMIAEVTALRVAEGWRGGPVGDLAALASAIVAFSHAGEAGSGDAAVLEAELNPLIVGVRGEGVTAVDALVRLGD
ncbi:MAG: CoA-binding protein [Streptosporangiales bacterium]|nr:CoA-binding protein [Streptosporangiales bacterium]